MGEAQGTQPTRAVVHLDRLGHNLRLLQELAGDRPVWPAVKANAYGHGAERVARHLVGLGVERLCVARPSEAIELLEAGVRARFLVLSASLPEAAEEIVAHDLEPVVSTVELIEALARAAGRAGQRVAVHVKVDTGMGRVGVRSDEVKGLLARCRAHPELIVRGLMSHFPRADEADKSYSIEQLERFAGLVKEVRGPDIEFVHLANSAALFDLPDARFDAVRPGISIYGLRPPNSPQSPRVAELQPVLEWRTRITFLKDVPADTGLSYGHLFRTRRESHIATLPVGYGDGLHRLLSNRFEVLVGGVRCRQVGRITMDQTLVDVTALRGRVSVGDDVVLIGRQGEEEVTADELAEILGTINYEIVTSIAGRVPRIPEGEPASG